MEQTPKRRRRRSEEAPAAGGFEGKQPLGRTEALRAKPVHDPRHFQYARGSRAERPQLLPPQKNKYQRKHTLGWACLFLLSFFAAAGLWILSVPSLTGHIYAWIPCYLFNQSSVSRIDPVQLEAYTGMRRALDAPVIRDGITVDGVSLAGMTREEAVRAVNRTPSEEAHDFMITVSVQDRVYTLDSAQFPMKRNTEIMVDRAWAVGRTNTASLRGTGMTPFQERCSRLEALSAHPLAYQTALTYDDSAIDALAELAAAEATTEPVNASVASFDFGTKRFTFAADQSGTRLGADRIAGDIRRALGSGIYNVMLSYEPEEVLAEVTKSDLMNRFGRIASYTTKTTSNRNRNTNIDLSARAINGITVLPGDEFSFNRTTGERTEAKGYKPAAAISGGQTQDEIGGGVCQTSSTLFNAAARAGLEIVRRSPHAWPSSYVERGMDATVNWPGVDFIFRNNTDWPIFIVAWYSDRRVTCEIYGMSLGDGITMDLEARTTRVLPAPEGVKYVLNESLPLGTQKNTVQARTGYIVVTDRVTLQNGREIGREELFTSTYQAYQETVEYH